MMLCQSCAPKQSDLTKNKLNSSPATSQIDESSLEKILENIDLPQRCFLKDNGKNSNTFYNGAQANGNYEIVICTTERSCGSLVIIDRFLWIAEDGDTTLPTLAQRYALAKAQSQIYIYKEKNICKW